MRHHVFLLILFTLLPPNICCFPNEMIGFKKNLSKRQIETVEEENVKKSKCHLQSPEIVYQLQDNFRKLINLLLITYKEFEKNANLTCCSSMGENGNQLNNLEQMEDLTDGPQINTALEPPRNENVPVSCNGKGQCNIVDNKEDLEDAIGENKKNEESDDSIKSENKYIVSGLANGNELNSIGKQKWKGSDVKTDENEILVNPANPNIENTLSGHINGKYSISINNRSLDRHPGIEIPYNEGSRGFNESRNTIIRCGFNNGKTSDSTGNSNFEHSIISDTDHFADTSNIRSENYDNQFPVNEDVIGTKNLFPENEKLKEKKNGTLGIKNTKISLKTEIVTGSPNINFLSNFTDRENVFAARKSPKLESNATEKKNVSSEEVDGSYNYVESESRDFTNNESTADFRETMTVTFENGPDNRDSTESLVTSATVQYDAANSRETKKFLKNGTNNYGETISKVDFRAGNSEKDEPKKDSPLDATENLIKYSKKIDKVLINAETETSTVQNTNAGASHREIASTESVNFGTSEMQLRRTTKRSNFLPEYIYATFRKNDENLNETDAVTEYPKNVLDLSSPLNSLKTTDLIESEQEKGIPSSRIAVANKENSEGPVENVPSAKIQNFWTSPFGVTSTLRSVTENGESSPGDPIKDFSPKETNIFGTNEGNQLHNFSEKEATVKSQNNNSQKNSERFENSLENEHKEILQKNFPKKISKNLSVNDNAIPEVSKLSVTLSNERKGTIEKKLSEVGLSSSESLEIVGIHDNQLIKNNKIVNHISDCELNKLLALSFEKGDFLKNSSINNQDVLFIVPKNIKNYCKNKSEVVLPNASKNLIAKSNETREGNFCNKGIEINSIHCKEGTDRGLKEKLCNKVEGKRYDKENFVENAIRKFELCKKEKEQEKGNGKLDHDSSLETTVVGKGYEKAGRPSPPSQKVHFQAGLTSNLLKSLKRSSRNNKDLESKYRKFYGLPKRISANGETAGDRFLFSCKHEV